VEEDKKRALEGKKMEERIRKRRKMKKHKEKEMRRKRRIRKGRDVGREEE
jgi:hypothetical protein